MKPVKLFHTLPKQKLAILIIYSNDAYALTCEYNSPENIFQILHGTVSSKPCHKHCLIETGACSRKRLTENNFEGTHFFPQGQIQMLQNDIF